MARQPHKEIASNHSAPANSMWEGLHGDGLRCLFHDKRGAAFTLSIRMLFPKRQLVLGSLALRSWIQDYGFARNAGPHKETIFKNV
jgi:hypothetical protein